MNPPGIAAFRRVLGRKSSFDLYIAIVPSISLQISSGWVTAERWYRLRSSGYNQPYCWWRQVGTC
jgi:hypothetical protein